jgi:hypothetical protein
MPIDMGVRIDAGFPPDTGAPLDGGLDPDTGVPPAPDAGPPDTGVAPGIQFVRSFVGSASNSSVVTSAQVMNVPDTTLIAVVSSLPSRPVVSVSGLDVTWTELVSQCSANAETSLSMWITSEVPSVQGSVFATVSGGNAPSIGIVVSAYRGVRSIGVARGSNASAGPCFRGPDGSTFQMALDPVSSGSWVVAAVAGKEDRLLAAPGFTIRTVHIAGAGAAAGIGVFDQIAAMSPVRVAGELASTTDWAVGAVELRP